MYTESSRRERQLQRQSIVSEELLGRSFEKRVRSSWRKHQGLFPYGKIRGAYAYISAVDFIFICSGFRRISRHALVPFIETNPYHVRRCWLRVEAAQKKWHAYLLRMESIWNFPHCRLQNMHQIPITLNGMLGWIAHDIRCGIRLFSVLKSAVEMGPS